MPWWREGGVTAEPVSVNVSRMKCISSPGSPPKFRRASPDRDRKSKSEPFFLFPKLAPSTHKAGMTARLAAQPAQAIGKIEAEDLAHTLREGATTIPRAFRMIYETFRLQAIDIPRNRSGPGNRRPWLGRAPNLPTVRKLPAAAPRRPASTRSWRSRLRCR